MKVFFMLSLLLTSLASFATDEFDQRPGYCPQLPSIQCEQKIISKIPFWERNDARELQEISRSCLGNEKASCLNIIMKKVPRWETNNLRDLTRIAKSCQLTNTECLIYIANKIPDYDFNQISETNKVARACANASVTCIEQKCSSLDYNCHFTDGLLKAASRCYQACD
ncbi:MAG: hypothetical protein HON90_06945 [Halobacteriovoraceae bacterium]|jgi:hypothetical protein|nr:hypothetical protein [Halobacteriovoraceae bacterium]